MNLREAYRKAKERADTEKTAVSVFIAGAGTVAGYPLVGAAAVLVDRMSGMEPSTSNALLTATVLTLNLISIQTAKDALEQEGYAASPGTTLLNYATEKPFLSATLDHITNIGVLAAPGIALGAFGNDPEIAVKSFWAASLAVPMWNISANSAILAGVLDPVVERLKEISDPPAIEPVANLDYHRFQRDMRQSKNLML